MSSDTLTFGSLFAGIGAFDLGFERAGLTCSWQVEIDQFCRSVLAKHWPAVRRWDDVRTFPPTPSEEWKVDVICGGFPCQDISGAGRKSGIDGERSGLWADFARLISELRPAYAIVENVADLLHRGIGRVLGDLATLGYDAEWHAVPVCAVGGPHERDRCWIIAHPNERQRPNRRAPSIRRRSEGEGEGEGIRLASDSPPLLGKALLWEQQDRALRSHWTADWQEVASSLRGVDDGISCRVDGLAALGNTLVPQIPEMIGRAILATQKEGRAEARPEISKPNCKPHHRPAQPKEITR